MRTDDYTLRKFETAEAFLRVCLEWLLADGVANNSLLAVVQSIAAGKLDFGGDHWFGTIAQGQRIKGCAVHEHIDGLMTTQLPDGTHHLVADSIVADNLNVRKVYGPEHDSTTLARALCKNGSRTWEVTHHWDCLATHSVEWPASKPNGELRKSNGNERATIEAWAEQYEEEKPAPISVRDFILRKLEDGDLYIWDDRGPKMMLSVSGRTPVCARISAAFTPREFRKLGYASSAVATLAAQLLDQGHQHTTVMVETEEQHLHRMYRRIGFDKKDSRLNIVLT